MVREIAFKIASRLDVSEAIQSLHALSKPYLAKEFAQAWGERQLAGIKVGDTWYATPTQAENLRDYESLIDELARSGIIARHIRTFKIN